TRAATTAPAVAAAFSFSVFRLLATTAAAAPIGRRFATAIVAATSASRITASLGFAFATATSTVTAAFQIALLVILERAGDDHFGGCIQNVPVRATQDEIGGTRNF